MCTLPNPFAFDDVGVLGFDANGLAAGFGADFSDFGVDGLRAK